MLLRNFGKCESYLKNYKHKNVRMIKFGSLYTRVFHHTYTFIEIVYLIMFENHFVIPASLLQACLFYIYMCVLLQ